LKHVQGTLPLPPMNTVASMQGIVSLCKWYIADKLKSSVHETNALLK
jgi:hypothetical protein